MDAQFVENIVTLEIVSSWRTIKVRDQTDGKASTNRMLRGRNQIKINNGIQEEVGPRLLVKLTN